jgi:hypothetical protein
MIDPLEPEEIGGQQVIMSNQYLHLLWILDFIVVLILVNRIELLFQRFAAALQNCQH